MSTENEDRLVLSTNGDQLGEEYLFSTLACGAREVSDALITQARELADLPEEQRTVRLGGTVVGIEFDPSLPPSQAERFAVVMAQGLGVGAISLVRLNPGGQPPTPLDSIRLT